MQPFIKQIQSDIISIFKKWLHDFSRIWKKSPAMALILLVSQIALGLIPYFVAVWFGAFFDTLISARSLGFWTDDINSAFWQLLGLAILTGVSLFITQQFSGTGASVARGVRWFVFALSVLVSFVIVAPVLILVIAILLIIEIWSKQIKRVAVWVLLFVIISLLYREILEAIIYESINLGEGLAYGALLCLIPVRQFIDRFFICE